MPVTILNIGCKADGCERKHYAKEYCSAHYQAFLLHGEDLVGKRSRFKETAPVGFKTCRECLEVFPATEEFFYKTKRSPTFGTFSWSTYCRPCDKAKSRLAQTPEFSRKHTLKRHYNITIEQYDELLASQNGVCAICGLPPLEGGRRLCVDHDHACCPDGEKTCGECIRGLLCLTCNQAIGMLATVELLKNAQTYLERSNG